MDKSRFTKRTDTENTVKKVNKSGSISRTSLFDKSTKIENSSEIDICNDNLSIFFLSGHRESLSSVTPDQQRTPCKNKRKKTSDTLITWKETIQKPVNPSKKGKMWYYTWCRKIIQEKDLHCLVIR